MNCQLKKLLEKEVLKRLMKNVKNFSDHKYHDNIVFFSFKIKMALISMKS